MRHAAWFHRDRILGLLAVLAVTFFLLFLAARAASKRESDPQINEVCIDNFSLLSADENGDFYYDYVELYNPGSTAVSLDGYWLSDDPDELQKYSLAGQSVPAGGYLILWVDEDVMTASASPFSLADEGDMVVLSKDDGTIADAVSVPEIRYNTVYARENDTGEFVNETATPGISNTGAQSITPVTLAEPAFSAESGFYDEAFSLVITAGEGEEIYYTLDGSEPTTGSIHYDGPIQVTDRSEEDNALSAREDMASDGSYTPEEKVDKATVIRAIAVNPETGEASDPVTRTYFVGYQNRTEYDGFPILSLTVDPDDLTDYETGIYVNGATMDAYIQMAGETEETGHISSYTDENGTVWNRYEQSNAFHRGKAWERETSAEFFDENHTLVDQETLGVRIAGESSRAHAQKSLNLYSRTEYGSSEMSEEVGALISSSEAFPFSYSYQMTEMSKLRLRSSGVEGALGYQDEFLQYLVSDRDIDTQAARPIVVFLNGEYWGLYELRTQYRTEYFTERYGAKEDDVWIIKSDNAEVGGDKALNSYETLFTYVSTYDMSDETSYEIVESWVDLQSLIDYYCFEVYMDNEDVSREHNIEMWRTAWDEGSAPCDGKWRFMAYDIDISLQDPSHNTFEEYKEKENNFYLPQYLYANENFRKQFCLTFMDLMNSNFSYENVHSALETWSDYCSEQIVKTRHRFSDEAFTEEDYQETIDAVDSFFQERPTYMIPYLKEELQLSGEAVTVTIQIESDGEASAEGGSVAVNTITEEEARWEGQYFTDYPISLTACPNEGWHFAGWKETGSSEASMEAAPEEGLVLTAVFEKD